MDATPSAFTEGNRFAEITSENHSAYLWISSILCLIYSSLILFVRLHLKWKLYGADDITASTATVRDSVLNSLTMKSLYSYYLQILQIGQVVPLLLAMKNGLGKSNNLLSDGELAFIGRVRISYSQ
jgi:hypothetical protein